MSASTPELTLLLGTSNMGPGDLSTPFTFDSPQRIKEILDCWYELGGRRIDTARIYGSSWEVGPGGSERCLKEYGAAEKFIIDTKVSSFVSRIIHEV